MTKSGPKPIVEISFSLRLCIECLAYTAERERSIPKHSDRTNQRGLVSMCTENESTGNTMIYLLSVLGWNGRRAAKK